MVSFGELSLAVGAKPELMLEGLGICQKVMVFLFLLLSSPNQLRLLSPAVTQKLHNYEDFMKLSQKATEIPFLML